MMGPTMNLISGTHHSYERKEYVFIVFREYTIISQIMGLGDRAKLIKSMYEKKDKMNGWP